MSLGAHQPRLLSAHVAQKIEAFFHLTNNFAYPLLLLLSLLLLPNLIVRTTHGLREVLIIDIPLFFGTTLSIASFYLASEREIARLRAGISCARRGARCAACPWCCRSGSACVNQTRAVIEAMLGRETEFVRTPKHGLRSKLESWSGKRHRAARSLTPAAELLTAGNFMVAVDVAIEHGHYISVPFLLLFLFGFGQVGTVSAWLGQSLGRFWQRRESAVSLVAAPLVVAMPDCTPGPVLITSDRAARPARSHAGSDRQDSATV